MKKKIEYKCVEIKSHELETEKMLNELAKEGWRVICSYAYDNSFIILERIR